jgi:hypothetical protein
MAADVSHVTVQGTASVLRAPRRWPQHCTPRRAAEVLWGLERGADVVVFKESDFAARRDVVASLPWTITREGQLLHGA